MQRGLDELTDAGSMIGTTPPSLGMAGAGPGPAATPPAFQGQRPGMAAGQPDQGGFEAAFRRMTGGEPRIAAPPVRTLAEGGYDPSRDMRMIRGRQEFQLGQMEDDRPTPATSRLRTPGRATAWTSSG